MGTHLSTAGRVRLAILAAVVTAVVLALLPGAATTPASAAGDEADYGFQGEGEARIRDVDNRPGLLAPSEQQRALAERLGAEVRWNSFGTPHMISNWQGYLSEPSDGAAVDVARAWIAGNRELFRLDEASVAALEVVKDTPLYDAPDLRRVAAGQEPRNPDVAHAVLFRQRLGDLDHSLDGDLGIGVDAAGRIVSAWSSVTGNTDVTNTAELTLRQAYVIAAEDVGRTVDISGLEIVEDLTAEGFKTFRVPGSQDLQYARLSAVATAENGVRLVWEVDVIDATAPQGHPVAFIHYIDAQTGEVLVRHNGVQHFAETGSFLAQSDEEGDGIPYWLHFPGFPEPVPPLAEPVEDTRQRWCWVPGPDCDRIVGPGAEEEDPAQPQAWDEDGFTGAPSFTTTGNNARTAISEQNPLGPDTEARRPYSPTREYAFDWTNVWFTSNCDPSNFQREDRNRNDEEAATTNLFVGHNRIHDYGYYLGWTEENHNLQVNNYGKTASGPYPLGQEGDPEYGQSQAGRQNPAFLGRDNANQITLQDGVPGITNQYLWQSLQAGFYAPCVDGAYDMSIVGHEVGHAIQNRMTGGPNKSLSGDMAGSMGESWSDLTAMEYLNAYDFVPVADESRYAVGPYATGDKWAAIRNYNMSASPLNFSDIQYDGNGTTSPHADGEIWTATNFDIRQAYIRAYNDRFPASDKELQVRCADGELGAQQCPGNRRWIQTFHDAFLIQPPAASMIDARDAYLAADKMRFDGANQDLLWDNFAARGLGQEAETTPGTQCVFEPVSCPPGETVESGTNDDQPTPGWTSPLRSNHATVTFRSAAVGGGEAATDMSVYVGVYEARVTPAADTVEDTEDTEEGPGVAIPDTIKMAPGEYTFIAQAPGYGAFRFTQTFSANEEVTVDVPLRRNHASFFNGSEATGDGGNFKQLIDDTERTNWASFEDGDIRGKQVTVKLGTGRQLVREVQVSAALRPAGVSEDPADQRDPDPQPSEEPTEEPTEGETEEAPEDDPPYDTGGQNRFSALRSFEILTCDSTGGSACEAEEDFTSVYVSPQDAFPAHRPRPRAPELTLRPFDVEDSRATHVRIKVLENQCTGGPLYTSEMNPDDDPANDPDCETGFSTIGAANTNQQRRDNSQVQNVRIAELQVFAEPEPFLGDPCADVQPASHYRDRPQARDVHVRNVDCVIFRRIAVGEDREGVSFYDPLENVTRAQMASFIVNDLRSAGFEDSLPSGRGENEFNDIDKTIHARNINRLARAGVVSGKTANRYAPNAKITREQMATFMFKAYALALETGPGDGDNRFRDVASGNTHKTSIERGADLGLFSGTTATRFSPGERVKRDQMASFLINLLKAMVPQFR